MAPSIVRELPRRDITKVMPVHSKGTLGRSSTVMTLSSHGAVEEDVMCAVLHEVSTTYSTAAFSVDPVQ
jgi:hypothetical protein